MVSMSPNGSMMTALACVGCYIKLYKAVPLRKHCHDC